jgi:adenylate kinase
MQPQHVGRSLINNLCRASQAFAQAANRSVAAAAPASAASYSSSSSGTPLRWVFLGPPGVGKGTYASRIAAALNVAHIAAGDLVRAEIKSGSTLGQQMQAIVSKGQLLPDEVIIEVSVACW